VRFALIAVYSGTRAGAVLTASPYTGAGRSVKRVVAHAVTCEPVSTVKFSANREKNREFYKIAVLGSVRDSK
jgi:hypothetical protein